MLRQISRFGDILLVVIALFVPFTIMFFGGNMLIARILGHQSVTELIFIKNPSVGLLGTGISIFIVTCIIFKKTKPENKIDIKKIGQILNFQTVKQVLFRLLWGAKDK